MSPCSSPIPRERLRDYFAGELADADAAALEEHVFECDACSAELDREGALAAALRAQIPPVITHRRLAALERAGLLVKKVPIPPGRAVDVAFAPELGLLVNALTLVSDDAERIDLSITDDAGNTIIDLPAIPFDRGTGEVLIACQRHFEHMFPPLIRFELTEVKGSERRPLGSFAVNHVWEH